MDVLKNEKKEKENEKMWQKLFVFWLFAPIKLYVFVLCDIHCNMPFLYYIDLTVDFAVDTNDRTSMSSQKNISSFE